ncbi:MAG: 3-oxoacyl-(acyl-carrier-protein) reductase FabG [Syntrophorhabdus sp. PtaU1.Bin058]|nr:MAG: 3-oxoacyl-(acyl-carrier-protein) reductase FabG [Syntrophorhabdus sp. PtaU1.Bin058]
MDLGIEGKVAVITGASEGIGRAIAMRLALEGVKVAICGRRRPEIDRTADEIRETAKTDEVIGFTGDMVDRNDAGTFIEKVIERFATVHILVNNVGRAQRGLFNDLSEEDWHAAFGANLAAAIHCTRASLPYMQKQRWGRVINVASISGKEPTAGIIASNSAKSALISFSKTLAAEVARDGILVNCVCPGRILSAQTVRLHSPEERDRIASSHIPVGRFGEPGEVANLVAFLASECSSYITGTAILVDGGMAKGLH